MIQINKITSEILAVHMLANQIHLSAKTYSAHLLAERIDGMIYGHIDTINELVYLTEPSISSAVSILNGAVSVLEGAPDYTAGDDKQFIGLTQLLLELAKDLQEFLKNKDIRMGIESAVQNLGQSVEFAIYLLDKRV